MTVLINVMEVVDDWLTVLLKENTSSVKDAEWDPEKEALPRVVDVDDDTPTEELELAAADDEELVLVNCDGGVPTDEGALMFVGCEEEVLLLEKAVVLVEPD